jgi:hypothetical protein
MSMFKVLGPSELVRSQGRVDSDWSVVAARCEEPMDSTTAARSKGWRVLPFARLVGLSPHKTVNADICICISASAVIYRIRNTMHHPGVGCVAFDPRRTSGPFPSADLPAPSWPVDANTATHNTCPTARLSTPLQQVSRCPAPSTSSCLRCFYPADVI